MKSFSAILYFEAAVRSIGDPVQVPFAACRTADVTRLPAAASMLNVKQKPETCGNLPCADGIRPTPFSSIDFSSSPLTSSVTTMFPNGRTPRTRPRVIGNGGVEPPDGQNADAPASGHVSAARRPPEFVIANSTPVGAYLVRIASVTTSPTRDSQSRPSVRPHTSAREISTVDEPIV